MVKLRGWRGQLGAGRRGPPLIQAVQPAESTPQRGLSPEGLGWAGGTMWVLGRSREDGDTQGSLCVQLDAPPGWSREPGGPGAGSMPQFPQL